MNPAFRLPPASRSALTPTRQLVRRLHRLIGQRFQLTRKTRTDGANIRKLVVATLESYPLPPAAEEGDYRIVAGRRKGLPRILREFLDTYIVTTGASYNLQVWNRNPAADSVQVEYRSGSALLASDARFALVRVSPNDFTIRSILILSPKYIERRFGRFGRPTVKQQLIITDRARSECCAASPPIIFHPDSPETRHLLSSRIPRLSECRIHDSPTPGQVVSLEVIRDLAASNLIGLRIPPGSTKNRGQALEAATAQLLGYGMREDDLLAGGYPDIPHQALEIKIQDAPTVDLGRYSPQFVEDVPSCPAFTTGSIRYLIALTDESSSRIKGIVVAPGSALGAHFTFVANTSFKCQRSIPMEFFDRFSGTVACDP